jgi:hypothetical protein
MMPGIKKAPDDEKERSGHEKKDKNAFRNKESGYQQRS